MNDKYNDFKDEDAQFNLDDYARDIHIEQGEAHRFPCYVIPHVWDKDDICLHCGFARDELYGNKAVEQMRAADGGDSAAAESNPLKLSARWNSHWQSTHHR